MTALVFLQHVTRWIGILFLLFYAYQLLPCHARLSWHA